MGAGLTDAGGGWLSSAIVAAAIAGIVTAAGWVVTWRVRAAEDTKARRQKVLDYLAALRAEIRGELAALNVIVDARAHLAGIAARYVNEPGYGVTVPSVPPQIIFEALAREIQILPNEVIDPIVLFARQHRAIASFAADMRDERFHDLSTERQLAMYADYLDMREQAKAFARYTIAAIDAAEQDRRDRWGLVDT